MLRSLTLFVADIRKSPFCWDLTEYLLYILPLGSVGFWSRAYLKVPQYGLSLIIMYIPRTDSQLFCILFLWWHLEGCTQIMFCYTMIMAIISHLLHLLCLPSSLLPVFNPFHALAFMFFCRNSKQLTLVLSRWIAYSINSAFCCTSCRKVCFLYHFYPYLNKLILQHVIFMFYLDINNMWLPSTYFYVFLWKYIAYFLILYELARLGWSIFFAYLTYRLFH